MALRQFFSIKVAKSDIVIDAGANIGQFTDYLCKSGATVYSFEPNPFAFEVLKDKFAKTPNVHCLPNAISDDSGMMKLYFHQNSDQDELHYSTGSSLLSVKKNILTDKYINVEVIDICAFISSLNQRIRILKMDIEGEECKVLKKIFETQIFDIIFFY